ncbi:MAG: YfhO family protein [Gemmatimonadota bacterium]
MRLSRAALLVPLGYAALYAAFFSPVLFTDRLLAPDDGVTFFLPGFLSRPVLWTDLLFAGFPVFADVQAQTWYPLARALAGVPGAWDPYVVSAYVLASCFTYGYARAIGTSRFAAAVAGLIFGMSGFLIAHLRHVTFLHTAAWLPLVLWSLERLRGGGPPGWIAAGAGAVALSALGGSPQLFVYGMGLASAYAVLAAWRSAGDRRRYVLAASAVLGLGVGLAAVQLVPSAELASLSPRSGMSLGDFTSYALSPRELPLLVFPYLLGGAFGRTYAGPWNLAELTGYVGLLPLLLAAVGAAGGCSRALGRFWGAVAVVAVLLALGPSTPLAWLVHQVPVYNLFKVPARHFLELSFAVAVLAALGADAIARGASARLVRRVAAAGAAIFGIGLAAALLLGGTGAAGGRVPTVAVAIPGVVLALSALALVAWAASPQDRARQAMVAALLLGDLAIFGWFFEWRTAPVSGFEVVAPPVAGRFRETLSATGQRLLSVSGHVGSRDELPVNRSRMWGVPSAAGYNPLLQSRLAEVIPVANWGQPQGAWASPRSLALDLLAVRYVLLPQAALTASALARAESFEPDAAGIVLGSGCGGPEPSHLVYHVPADLRAVRLELVTSLVCATAVPEGADVLRVRMRGIPDADPREVVLRAGEHTAEWMHDCPEVRTIVGHSRPPARSDLPVDRRTHPGAAACTGHTYGTSFPLPNGVRAIELEWVGRHGAIRVHELALADAGGSGRHVLDPRTSPLLDGARWRPREVIDGRVAVLENLRALPRAWVVPRVVRATPEEILEAVRTSTLPGGSRFDPRSVALVEQPVRLPAGGPGGTGSPSARILDRGPGAMHVVVETPEPALLVTSDAWYPGWGARVDGRPAPLLRVDYVLRGVPVPAGRHRVQLEFRPRSLRTGAIVSVTSFLLLAGVVAAASRDRRGRSPKGSADHRSSE